MAGFDDDYLTVNETARLLGRSTEQVRRYLREGVLRGQRVGGQWFVTCDDAEAMLRRRREVPSLTGQLFDADPLARTIAIGHSGGGNIAEGKIAYLRSIRQQDWP
jgi:excisionase family DNA binding protein